jgi:hypothetical protein
MERPRFFYAGRGLCNIPLFRPRNVFETATDLTAATPPRDPLFAVSPLKARLPCFLDHCFVSFVLYSRGMRRSMSRGGAVKALSASSVEIELQFIRSDSP